MSTETFTHDVFLSHSSKDKAVVRPLAERLRKDGVKVWFDEWVLKRGDSIPAKIEEGLEHARVLVLCMSANAFGSDPAGAGLEAGTLRMGQRPFRDPLNKERRFLPRRLDDMNEDTLPPFAEQTRIVAEVKRRLSMVEELESVVLANLQRAIRLRQSILQKAFTGKLS